MLAKLFRSVSEATGFAKPQDVLSEAKSGNPESEIIILAYPRLPSAASSATPFGGKLETMLLMAGLPYKAMLGDPSDTSLAPKSKFPVLKHGQTTVCDSSCIFHYLLRTYPQQMQIFVPTEGVRKAHAHALQRMLEDGLYFCFLYLMYQRDDLYAFYAPKLLPVIPGKIQQAAGFPGFKSIVRSVILRDLHGQGTGRHSFERVVELADEDLSTCEALLGQDKYLTGLMPTPADCMLFAILDLVLSYAAEGMPDNPFLAMVKSKANCVAFRDRIRTEYYPNGSSDQWSEVYKP